MPAAAVRVPNGWNKPGLRTDRTAHSAAPSHCYRARQAAETRTTSSGSFCGQREAQLGRSRTHPAARRGTALAPPPGHRRRLTSLGLLFARNASRTDTRGECPSCCICDVRHRAAGATTEERLLAGEDWITDGNYGSTLDVRLARADLVVIVQPARWRCVVGVLRRFVHHRGRPIQAPGCLEHLDLEFVRWVWRFPRDSRVRIDEALSRYSVATVELRTRGELRQFLNSVKT